MESDLHVRVKGFEIQENIWKRFFVQMTEGASEGYQRVDHTIQNTAA